MIIERMPWGLRFQDGQLPELVLALLVPPFVMFIGLPILAPKLPTFPHLLVNGLLLALLVAAQFIRATAVEFDRDGREVRIVRSSIWTTTVRRIAFDEVEVLK